MKLVDLVPIKEIDFNDPALMRARAAKDQMNQRKSNPRIGFDQALDLRGEKKDLELRINNLYREMESDPNVEAEGGPVADQYGDELNRLETRLYKINKEIASYDMSEGEDEDDEQDMADVKDDIASMMNEATEKSWNSIDVSRKAEKEISNKEWNERTTKKLDMLKTLNTAGKFKKDFDDERLQGWVDQNYSWEKLTRQFKLSESYTAMYETRDEVGIDEGSCGYGPDGTPGDTPGETRGMPADKRTMTMMREAIRKEIKKLSEKKGVPHYTKDGKEWKGATHKMPNGKLMTQDPHNKDSEELFHKEDLDETSLDDKLRGALGDKDFEKVINKPVPSLKDMIKSKPSKDKK